MRSLWAKLVLSFVAVIIISAGVVAVFARRAVSSGFKVYVISTNRMWTEAMASALAEYYRETGSWRDVDKLLNQSNYLWNWYHRPRMGMRYVMRPVNISTTPNKHVIVADETGRVVADSTGEMVGQRLSPEALAQGVPVIVNGKQVGTVLLVLGKTLELGNLEQAFLRAVNRSLLLAVLVGGGVAILLGVVLAYQITSPLRKLRMAASAIASGNLDQRVDINSTDEVGELARSFNEMAQALKANEQQRRQMIADIAHELRTPLSVIRGNLEAILDGVYPPEPEHLAPVYEEALLLQRLVEDLRLLSLAEAGELHLEKSSFDMAELLRKVIEVVRAEAQEKGINLELKAESPLPVYADAQRIRQVLNNLLSNALRYTPSGGRITVTARRIDAGVKVAVSDTGPGIPPEELPHIFDRFWRGDRSRSRSSGGSGLGLSIAKKLVEAHGGRIEVQSKPGKGTTFCFWIPAD